MIIDPYAMFPGLKLRINDDDEVLLSCPHPVHRHTDTNAAFNMRSGKYICFGKCGYKTNNPEHLLLWLQEICDLSAQLTYIDDNDIQKPEKTTKSLAEAYENLPLAYDHPYLQKRLVTNDVVEFFNIRTDEDTFVCALNYSPESLLNEQYLLGVNIRYTRSYAGIRYRYLRANSEDKRAPFYPMHLIDSYNRDSSLYLTEGMFGAFRLHSFGVNAAALLGSGRLDDMRALVGFENIFICVDNDKAGYKFWNKLYEANIKQNLMLPLVLLRPAEYDEIQYDQFMRMHDDVSTTLHRAKERSFFSLGDYEDE